MILSIALVLCLGLAAACADEEKTAAVTGVTLDKTEWTLTAGTSGTLTATVAPEDATDKTVTRSSSNAAVATVSAGTVTAVRAGSAVITATAGGIVCININTSALTLENCINRGAVSGGSGGTGGILAYANNNVALKGCTNEGAVGGDTSLFAAGILAYQSGTQNVKVENCANAGAIVGRSAGGVYGICGTAQAATLEGCSDSGEVTAKGGDAGGIAGNISSASLENCSGGGADIVGATGKYTGRLVGFFQGTGVTFSFDDAAEDDKTLPAFAAMRPSAVLTVTGGTLYGTPDIQNLASTITVVVKDGGAWDRYPGETGSWSKYNRNEWVKAVEA